jgi:Tol biopolymer transport system component
MTMGAGHVAPSCVKVATLAGAIALFGGCTGLVNVDNSAVQAENGSNSYDALISADGTAVGFTSNASNLAPGDANGAYDVFVRDLADKTTTRVSVGPDGAEADGASLATSISADGNAVAFHSEATNLFAGDTNASPDVLLHDRVTGETALISVDRDGGPANGHSTKGSVSADGTLVAFQSFADDLVAGETNRQWQIYVRDITRGTTSRVSTTPDGTEADDSSVNPKISADGRFVTFESEASNLVAGDTNSVPDVFVKDLVSGEIERVSITSDGAEATGRSMRPSISADGRYVAFGSDAADLVVGDTNQVGDSFVHDRVTGETTRVTVASGGAQVDVATLNPGISADGRYVTFPSGATTLVGDDTNNTGDVFIHDRSTGTTSRVSLTLAGAQANGNSAATQQSISADGHWVVFSSIANNLVADDRNGPYGLAADVYVRFR